MWTWDSVSGLRRSWHAREPAVEQILLVPAACNGRVHQTQYKCCLQGTRVISGLRCHKYVSTCHISARVVSLLTKQGIKSSGLLQCHWDPQAGR